MQENLRQNVSVPTKFAIGCKYRELSKRNKGMVAQLLAQECTGTRETWRKRLKAWADGKDFSCNSLVLDRAADVIESFGET